LRLISRAG